MWMVKPGEINISFDTWLEKNHKNQIGIEKIFVLSKYSCPPPGNLMVVPLHAKWSNFQNTQQNCTTFSGMLGEDKKMIREKNCEIFLKRDRANWKKATPKIWLNRL